MRSSIGVVSIVLGIAVVAFAAGDRENDAAELNAIKNELKPLRQLAYKEADVIAAKEKLDAAYREYWSTVRTAMLRLDPAKAALIEKDIGSRKSSDPIARNSPLKN